MCSDGSCSIPKNELAVASFLGGAMQGTHQSDSAGPKERCGGTVRGPSVDTSSHHTAHMVVVDHTHDTQK